MTAMKADGDLTSIVPAASIYRQSPPAEKSWPFVKYGAPTGGPIRASCVNGRVVTVAVHGFSKGVKDGAGAQTVTAEDHAGLIGDAIENSLDGRHLPITGGTAKVRWTGSQLLQDGAEADAYHVVVNFQVRCIT
jgi:hypothetical protein